MSGSFSLFCVSALFSVLAFAFAATLWSSIAYVAYTAVAAVYNLYFHPLAHFPGPRVAAASSWWQVYVELIKQESLSIKLLELNRKYGMYL